MDIDIIKEAIKEHLTVALICEGTFVTVKIYFDDEVISEACDNISIYARDVYGLDR